MRDGKNKRSLAVLSGTVSSHVSRLEISTAVSWARRPVEQLASKTKNFRQQWALSRIQKLRARIRLFKRRRRRRYERGKEKTVPLGGRKKKQNEKNLSTRCSENYYSYYSFRRDSDRVHCLSAIIIIIVFGFESQHAIFRKFRVHRSRKINNSPQITDDPHGDRNNTRPTILHALLFNERSV